MDMIVRKFTSQGDCPQKNGYEYTVISKTDEYEKRLYPASTWVCTSVTSMYQDTAKIEAFRTLQSYVKGQNEAGAQLIMQPPILTRVSPHHGLSFERKFVVSSFLSTDRSGKEPQPTNPDVYIDYLPEMTVFVGTFEGIACEEKWAHETRQLVQCLTNKEEIRMDTYFTATYDSPFQLMANKNEIWMIEYNKETAIESLERKHEFVQMGSKRLELPTCISVLLYFMLGCVGIVSSLFGCSVSTISAVRSNWEYINKCKDSLLKNCVHLLSWKPLTNIAVMSFSTFWKVSIGVVKSLKES